MWKVRRSAAFRGLPASYDPVPPLDKLMPAGIVTYTLPYPPLTGIRVAEDLDFSRRALFRRCFDDLDAVAAAIPNDQVPRGLWLHGKLGAAAKAGGKMR